MSNFLDARCAKCGRDDQIEVEATLCVLITEDGTDPDESSNRGNWDYDSDSPATCLVCGHTGKLQAFETSEEVEGQPSPPDPEGMNENRSAWAAAALAQFQQVTGADDCDAVCDLLGDLMHWCDRHGQDFSHQLQRARDHYAAETLPID